MERRGKKERRKEEDGRETDRLRRQFYYQKEEMPAWSARPEKKRGGWVYAGPRKEEGEGKGRRGNSHVTLSEGFDLLPKALSAGHPLTRRKEREKKKKKKRE